MWDKMCILALMRLGRQNENLFKVQKLQVLFMKTKTGAWTAVLNLNLDCNDLILPSCH